MMLIALFACFGCGRLRFDAVTDGPTADADELILDAPFTGPMSCRGLLANCGPMGNRNCCENALVVGGTFYREYDLGTDMAFTDMTLPATVSSLHLDLYEVTVGRFRKFVEAGLGTQLDPPSAGAGARVLNGMADQAGWDPAWNVDLAADTAALIANLKCDPTLATWTDAPGANENLPINCVDWLEASAFCLWDDAFLPTEAESMYAANGGDEQRAFPWSNPPDNVAIDCTQANFATCMPTMATNVGSLPAGNGRWGHADMSGNVWEWVTDWYFSPPPVPCNDCSNQSSVGNRSFRGGAMNFGSLLNRPAWRRNYGTPDYRYYSIGVRCARRIP